MADLPVEPLADFRERIGRATIPALLSDREERRRLGMRPEEDDTNSFVVELNLQYNEGIERAAAAFEALYASVVSRASPPERLSKSYVRCDMSLAEARLLVHRDEEEARRLTASTEDDGVRERVIHKLWPDFQVHALMDRSIATVKADAAYRAYAASGSGIVWAVMDSGIDHTHAHFGDVEEPSSHTLLHPTVSGLHRDFTHEADRCVEQQTGGRGSSALADAYGHGTHVAGIIAGGMSSQSRMDSVVVYEQVLNSSPDGEVRTSRRIERRTPRPTTLRGVAPECRLVSLRVLDSHGTGRASDVMRALQYIREEVNGHPKVLRIHGVNLSIGYEFDAELFACGQSPLCVEVDRLVKSGVVVVVAAGNTGYGRITMDGRVQKVGLHNTINDPGNAALAITVGATHRESPHTYGVSYFSSKGPTGDGRVKPDLVAPGERITSCATSAHLRRLGLGPAPNSNGCGVYIDDSGTSLAAPHVSGAIAAFLSIRREFVQRPERVKEIFLSAATPLGRERYFEGHGLVDLMRAIQSV